MLYSVSGPTDRGKSYSETYGYDDYGRPANVSRTIDGTAYPTGQSYDTYGRPSVVTYPSGFQVKNIYNDFGFLKEVREEGGRTSFLNEVADKQLFWEADSYSIWGQVDGSMLGNGLSFDRVQSTVTGRVHAITAGINTGSNVQFHSYVYDALGNVMSRADGATGRSETFGYDGLNRLTSHAVAGGATVTVQYDALGNITNKSDVGSYAYGQNAGPHAVTAAGANSYTYDSNGNMMSGAGRTMTWTSFNQLKTVVQNGTTAEFWFGAGHERVLQQESNNTKTVYVGALYEVVTNPDGLTELKHYIMTPLGRTAVRTVRMNGTVETRYFHQDALGSIAAVTDEWGRVEKRYTFDAWGKRVNTLDTHSSSGGKVTRGFTDHEMLDDFGLIHMNGRVYDPVLGRFLSADSYVQDAGDSQSYNRYSYVSNNPLNATDPSGHFKLWKEFLGPVVQWVGTAVIYACTKNPAWASAWSSAIGATINGKDGAIQGAVSGYCYGAAGGGLAGNVAYSSSSAFSGSLLNGGSVGCAFKAGVVSGTISLATAGIAHELHIDTYWEQVFFSGCAGGVIEEAFGGSFRHGFISGLSNAMASNAISGFADSVLDDSELIKSAEYSSGDAYQDGKIPLSANMVELQSGAFPSGLKWTCDYDYLSGTFFVGFKGTTPSWSDWVANILNGVGLPTAQYRDAINIGTKYDAWARQYGFKLEFTGHSLGGGLAAAAALATRRNAITINASGSNSHSLAALGVKYNPADAQSLIHAYFVKGEILSLIQDATPLPNAAGRRIGLNPGNALGYVSPLAHALDQAIAATH